MTLINDPRKIFILLLIMLILICTLLRIKRHIDTVYYQQNIQDNSETIDAI